MNHPKSCPICDVCMIQRLEAHIDTVDLHLSQARSANRTKADTIKRLKRLLFEADQALDYAGVKRDAGNVRDRINDAFD